MIQKTAERVVVIGASGFVGKALCQGLLSSGYAVQALGRSEVDLNDRQASQTLESHLQVGDKVIFLSAITPDKGKTRLDFLNNLRMGMAVCDALARVRPSHLIYFSSDAVYRLEDQPVSESTPPAPEDLYGAMHRARELLCHTLGVPLLVVRPTLIYGRGDTHGAYGPNRFIKQAIQDKCIQLFGEGEETRSHISVGDVVSLVLKSLAQQETGILNAVSEPSLSFAELARLIQKNLPFPVEIKTGIRQNPITHRHLDLKQLYARFPSFVSTSPQDGIPLMVKQSLEALADATL